MNDWTEKLLLLAAGAAVGAVGYMAVKHPDELKKFVGEAAELGQNMMNNSFGSMGGDVAQASEAGEA